MIWSAWCVTGRSVLSTSVQLDAEQWTVRAGEYASRVERFVAPQARRAQVGEPHPVWDFLFSYYSLRPRQLRCWHPGYGVVLTGREAVRRYRDRRGYTVDGSGVTVSDDYLRSRLETISFVADLLRATARRPAQLNCFGLHEWAMVYRSGELRHDRVPLRLGAAQRRATGGDIAKAPAMPQPANGQLFCCDVGKAKPA